MARFAQFTILAAIVVAVATYAIFSHVYGGDKQAVLESLHRLSGKLGKWTIPVFVAFHAILISLCLPYAIILEAGAAYLFGFVQGILCVFSAKIMGASLSFWIGRTLFRKSTSARSWVQNNKFFHLISKGVARDGWKFVLLARFSPMPSYIVNYALAATDIRYFVDFLLPSLLGCIPMILQNTSIGSLTSAATKAGIKSEKAGVMTYVLPVIGLTSSALISWRIKKYTSSMSIPLSSETTSDDLKEGSGRPKMDADGAFNDDQCAVGNDQGYPSDFESSVKQHRLRQRTAAVASS